MPVSTVRILGIDPGLRVTGFGIIERKGASLTYIASGCVRSGDADLSDRLKTILGGLREIIGEHPPQQVALENLDDVQDAYTTAGIDQQGQEPNREPRTATPSEENRHGLYDTPTSC